MNNNLEIKYHYINKKGESWIYNFIPENDSDRKIDFKDIKEE